MNHKAPQIESRPGQQVQVDRSNVDRPLERKADGTHNLGPQPVPARAHQKQRQNQRRERRGLATSGTEKIHRTALSVRCQRVWSKK